MWTEQQAGARHQQPAVLGKLSTDLRKETSSTTYVVLRNNACMSGLCKIHSSSGRAVVGSLLWRTKSIYFSSTRTTAVCCVHIPDDIRPKAPLSDEKKGPPNEPQPASSQRDEETHQPDNTAGVYVWLKATIYIQVH